MSFRRKSIALFFAFTTALLANLYPHPILAAGPTTNASTKAKEVTKCVLTLAPRILDPRANAVGAIAGTNMIMHTMDLVDQKPPVITKEPKYVGRPLYGAFRVGDGPKSVTYFAIDEAKGFAGKIYVDENQNGDLTDDGPADWDDIHVPTWGRYCEKVVTVHASWGTALEEKESGDYTVILTKPDGKPKAAFVKITGRTGNLKLGDKTYPVVLAENTGDGIYTIPADADMTRAPVTLYIDTDDMTPFESPKTDGRQRHPEKFNIAHQFQLEGHWYFARPSISGGALIAQETTEPGASTPAPAVAPDKNPIGSVAPNFIVQTPDGKTFEPC